MKKDTINESFENFISEIAKRLKKHRIKQIDVTIAILDNGAFVVSFYRNKFTVTIEDGYDPEFDFDKLISNIAKLKKDGKL